MESITIFVILYGILPSIFLKIFKLQFNAIKPFVWVVLVASLYEFIGTFILKLNSEYWFIIYKILAFISIHYFFYKILYPSYNLFFRLFILLFLLLSVYCFYNWVVLNFFDVNAYYNFLQTIVVLFFSVLWFIRVFNNLEVESLLSSSTFYFISGLLLYYSGTVFLFLLSNMIFKMDKSSFQDYWMLNVVLNLVLRTLLILGIWKGCKK